MSVSLGRFRAGGNLRAHGSALLVIALWSATYVLTKIALAEMGPISLALFRNGVATIVLVIWFLAIKPAKLLPRKADYPILFGLGVCGVGFFYMLQNIGLRYTTATDTALLVTASPAIVAALAVFVLGEPCGWRRALGIGLASLGVVTLAVGGSTAAHTASNGGGRAFGDAVIALTALGWALYTVYGKGLLTRYSTLALTTYTTVLGTVVLIPLAAIETIDHPSRPVNLLLVACGLYLGVLGSAVGYVLWNHALRLLPAGTVSAYLYIRPLFTAILAAALLNERPTVTTGAGAALIILGATLSFTR
jgi:drug/metabolite transporter (DMT)-like permease